VGDGAGKPGDPIEREEIAQFLDQKLARPLFTAPETRLSQIERGIDQMSIAERILIELEMRGGERNMYSFDYDPLDGRW
jgi:hypothetical protein